MWARLAHLALDTHVRIGVVVAQIVECLDEVLEGNRIVGSPEMNNSKIIFGGKGCVLYCEDGVVLLNSRIEFKLDNGLVILRKSKHPYRLDIVVWNDCVFCMGENNYINGTISAVISERQNVMIGDDGLFSFGVWIRTADPHLVYSCETGKRINPSKSIFIGDHVWVGQDVKLLKGTRIGSGSIVAAGAVVAGKIIESNSSWGGVPAKQLSKGVFFLSNSVHGYTEEKTESSKKCSSQKWIYGKKDNSWHQVIDDELKSFKSAEDKLSYMVERVFADESKNRFSIVSEAQSAKKRKSDFRRRLSRVKKKLLG